MANRSYLYSVNEIPTKKSSPDFITGLSEFSWDIPLIYKILLTGNPQKCSSIIWDNQQIGIVSNYQDGVRKLETFLDILEQEDINNKNEFQKHHKEIMNFLKKESNKDMYIVLEAGEIFDAEEIQLDESVSHVIDEIKSISKDLDQLLETKAKPKKWYSIFRDIFSKSERKNEILRKLKSDWKNELGIDCWSNNLYFDFPKKRKKKSE